MISVLCPSRGRPEMLIRSVMSLLDTAAGKENVEILVGLDPDDYASIEACKVFGDRLAYMVAPERWGYEGFHKYCDAMAAEADGDWLMLWNDDALMKTRRWDAIIQARSPVLLWARTNFMPWACTFSIWPKSWYDALGYTAPTPHIDTYLQRIGDATGLYQRIPVEIFHDRFDITGNEAFDDQTFEEGRKALGFQGMHGHTEDNPHGDFPFHLLPGDIAKIKAL